MNTIVNTQNIKIQIQISIIKQYKQTLNNLVLHGQQQKINMKHQFLYRDQLTVVIDVM